MSAAPAQTSAAVRAVTSADRQQLEQLYLAHHQIIWRTLRRMGFSPEAAADHTQQAYLIALERLDRILPGSERAFLFSTAIYFGRTVLRKERRLELSDEVDAGSDDGASARGLDQRQVALDLLARIMGGLDPDLVTVFTLYEIEGLSSPEIAELIGIPLGTVASRLRRAREAFRSRAARVERGPAIVKRKSP